MTEHDRTTEPETVEAELLHYDAARGFGFATSMAYRDADRVPIRIFFHRSACRKVGGTPKKPILTGQRATHDLKPDPYQRQRMLVRVVKGERGLKAVAWGVPPKRTILTDLVEDGGVRRFVGGTVSVMHYRQRDCFLSGTVQSAELAPGCLWLGVSDAYVNGRSTTHPMLLELQLGEGYGAPQGDTAYVLSVDGFGFDTRATFYLPERQSQ
ncbi:MAG TPA: hypothetical protein VLA88_04530 [Candidatus Saccharimonadales bacterium]|nr:hypothetical protein [Candidatus Saccharimonadales bacterium]